MFDVCNEEIKGVYIPLGKGSGGSRPNESKTIVVSIFALICPNRNTRDKLLAMPKRTFCHEFIF
jgi:hypothetical protein